MNNSIKLEPQAVFECFKEVNGVPRPSKHEEKMIAFLQDFGRKHGLETEVDDWQRDYQKAGHQGNGTFADGGYSEPHGHGV